MDGLKHIIHNQNNLDEYSLFGIGEASVCFEKATSRLKILIIIKWFVYVDPIRKKQQKLDCVVIKSIGSVEKSGFLKANLGIRCFSSMMTKPAKILLAFKGLLFKNSKTEI